MRTIFPDEVSPRDFHQFMLGSVTPRPIAFVSTVDENGNKNLAPFSYFNAISSNPPILVFSVNRNPDGSKKDTLINIEKTGECVVNMVSMDMSVQMTLASVHYQSDIDEFQKSGFNPVVSDTVKAPRVGESPVSFECKLDRIIDFGDYAGASSLIICNVNCVHIKEEAINENNRIDSVKLDLIGRLGRAYYLRINEENVFAIPQSKTKTPIGFDKLPEFIKNSNLLTGNEIGQIAGLRQLPNHEEIVKLIPELYYSELDRESINKLAKAEIAKGNIEKAAAILLMKQK